MKVSVYTKDGSDSGKSVDLSSAVFEIEPNKEAIYYSVTADMAHKRQGSRSTKTKGEVSGSGKKPWRQKGTGRARVGTLRAPQRRGGSHAFAIKPGTRRYKINRKVNKLARRSAFSAQAKGGNIRIIETFKLEAPKTRDIADLLKNLQIENNLVLMLVSELEENVLMSARNMPNILIVKAEQVSTYDILSCEVLLIEDGAVESINNSFDKNGAKATGETE